MPDTLSIVVWNVQFRTRTSWQGEVIRSRIAACEPHIACITEGHPDFLDMPHRIAADPDHGYPNTEDRRKVLVWSRQPWVATDPIGDRAMPPGRYASARTSTPLGEMSVHGVCIPWRDAHVSTGRRDSAPWDEHLRYLDGLARILRGVANPARSIVLGDYNQRIPRRWAPEHVHAVLAAAFPLYLTCATAGPIPPSGRRSIDHLHHGPGLAVLAVRELSDTDDAGRPLSDHFGLHVVLGAAPEAESG